jgi:Glycosyl hydrolases family 25
MGYPKGVDVASYQSKTFSTSGLAFFFVKCTESNNYVNPNYTAQLAHGRVAKLVPGHYLFQRPGSVSAQANYFLAHADIKAGDMIAVDWEDSGVSDADKNAMIAYLQAKKPKTRVLLYCNLSFWKSKDKNSVCGDGLWIAAPSDPDGKPSVSHAWAFQQTGISGTDIDIANFPTKAALQTWASSKGVTPPTPTPKPTPTPEPSLNQAQQVNSLYNDAMKIVSLDTNPDGTPEGQHAIGFFVAHTRHDALVSTQQLAALIVMVQEIHDKLFSVEPAAARPEESERR